MKELLIGLLALGSITCFANDSASKTCELLRASAAVTFAERAVYKAERAYGGDPKIYGKSVRIRLNTVVDLLEESSNYGVNQNIKSSIRLISEEISEEASTIYMYSSYKSYYASYLVNLYNSYNKRIWNLYQSACN